MSLRRQKLRLHVLFTKCRSWPRCWTWIDPIGSAGRQLAVRARSAFPPAGAFACGTGGTNHATALPAGPRSISRRTGSWFPCRRRAACQSLHPFGRGTESPVRSHRRATGRRGSRRGECGPISSIVSSVGLAGGSDVGTVVGSGVGTAVSGMGGYPFRGSRRTGCRSCPWRKRRDRSGRGSRC